MFQLSHSLCKLVKTTSSAKAQLASDCCQAERS